MARWFLIWACLILVPPLFFFLTTAVAAALGGGDGVDEGDLLEALVDRHAHRRLFLNK
jgi:hypothetical protein